jgi:hypothetical protein
VGKTPVSPASIDFLKEVILTETNSDAVARASVALMDALRVPCVTEEEQANFWRLNDELRKENIPRKLKALSYLAQYEMRVV